MLVPWHTAWHGIRRFLDWKYPLRNCYSAGLPTKHVQWPHPQLYDIVIKSCYLEISYQLATSCKAASTA